MSPAAGQSWSGAAGDGLWSNGGNWFGGFPPADFSTSVTFSGGSGAIDLDLPNNYVFGSGSSIFTVNSNGHASGFQFSGAAIEFEPGTALVVSGENNEFSNDWLINGAMVIRLPNNNGTNDEFKFSGTATGTGSLSVHRQLTIDGTYLSTGSINVSGINVLAGSLRVNGIVGDGGTMSISGTGLSGTGLIDRDVVVSRGIIRGDNASPLSFNAGLTFVDGNGNPSSVQQAININDTMTVAQSATVNVATDADLRGNGTASIFGTVNNLGGRLGNATWNVESDGWIQGNGTIDGNVNLLAGNLSGHTVNGEVTVQSGQIDRGIYQNRVTVDGTIGRLGVSQDAIEFNADVDVVGATLLRNSAVSGTGSLNVSDVLTTSNVSFSNSINWNISGATAGDLGSGGAGSFLGNNVTLAGGQLNGTATNHVVAGNFSSTGNSLLNQSITVNGTATIAGGTLTVATGRSLAADELVIQTTANLINNGLLSLNDLVLESATVGGNIDLANQLTIRTTGQSQLLAGAQLDVAGLTEVQSGSLRIESGALLSGAGDVAIRSGSLLDLQGTIEKGIVVDAGGTLAGIGLVTGNIQLGGELGPGNSAGTLTLDGDLDVDTTAVICIEIGGTTAGIAGYDSIHGNGTSTATLDGLLEIDLLNGFVPDVADEFFVLEDFATLDGQFANTVGGVLLFGEGRFNVEYTDQHVRLFNYQLTAVPEPTSAGIALLCVIAGVSRRRRSVRQPSP